MFKGCSVSNDCGLSCKTLSWNGVGGWNDGRGWNVTVGGGCDTFEEIEYGFVECWFNLLYRTLSTRYICLKLVFTFIVDVWWENK